MAKFEKNVWERFWENCEWSFQVTKLNFNKTVFNVIENRVYKDIPLKQDVLSTDSASESSSSPSPPSSQLDRVRRYNLYFDEGEWI